MPGPKSPNVLLSEAERAELQALVRAQKTSQHIALRARLLLLLAGGLPRQSWNAYKMTRAPGRH